MYVIYMFADLGFISYKYFNAFVVPHVILLVVSLSYFRNNNWVSCPTGYFLRGLYRSAGNWLSNIELGKCCKPANHPRYHGSCYHKDVTKSFDNSGWTKCNSGYFLVGLYRSKCNRLSCIEKFKCCQMVNSKFMN